MGKEVSNNFNSKIKCNVLTCLYNDCNSNHCKLNEIRVGSSCCNDDVTSKDDTLCNSYEKKK